MKTGSGSTPASTPATPAKRRARGKSKPNGRDHSVDDGTNTEGTVSVSAADLAAAAEATGGGFDLKAGDYAIRKGCFFGFKPDGMPYRLCNFTARITHELRSETGTKFRIEATLSDKSVRSFVLTAREFGNPRNWVTEKLGARGLITVGQHERLTAAIQATSDAIGIEHETAGGTTGYAIYDGRPVFVAPNRVIGLPGMDTSRLIPNCPEEVQRYSLAEPPTGDALVAALEAAARIPGIGDLAVTLPLWLMAFRPALPFVPPPAFVVWPYGVTGTLKSSVSALCLNLFGRRWNYRELPATFLDTKTSLEAVIHFTRCLFVVLDDAVADSKRGVDAVEGTVGYVLRSVGNGTGRGRSNQDLFGRPKRVPRSAVAITSERLPPGGTGSAAARALCVHMKIGDIDKRLLSQAQHDGRDGVLEAAMSGFIQNMLAEDEGRFVAAFQATQARYHDRVDAALHHSSAHGRTTGAVIDLVATAEVVAETFGRHGVKLPFDIEKALDVLTGSGGAHANAIAPSNPTLMFRRTLRELIESGRVQIAERTTGGCPKVHGRLWGWSGNDHHQRREETVIGFADIEGLEEFGLGAVQEVFLRRDATYAVVRDTQNKAGETLGLDVNSMWSALVDQGLVIVNAKTGKSTFPIRVGKPGVQQRLMKCRADILSDEARDTTDGSRAAEQMEEAEGPAEPEDLKSF